MFERGNIGNYANIGTLLTIIVGGFWLVQPALVSPRPKDMTFPDGYNTHKTLARLWQDPFECVKELKKKEFPGSFSPYNTVDNILHEKKSICNDSNTKVLAIMVPGLPYEDRVERRIRYRVALSYSMAELEYNPVDSERIGCIQFSSNFKNLPVPYEWYVKEEDGKDKKADENTSGQCLEAVLVLWIDEDEFGLEKRPLTLLKELRNKLVSRHISDEKNFHVIGPYSSGTLRMMEREAQNGHTPSEGSTLTVYNYSATHQKENVPPQVSSDAMSVKHLISSDKSLAELMYKELKLRQYLFDHRVWQKRKIILLAEHDTDYARNLLEVFSGQTYECDFDFKKYTYLRGIDGSTAREKLNKEKEGITTSPSSADIQLAGKWMTNKRPNIAEGNNQLDYVIRLAKMIKRDHGTPFAIGILGSDIYDKLMLLKELRSQFPEVLFFTTDYDSLYSDLPNFRDARGLLIASAYGPRLNKKFQEITPSFRGVYQTALFHAVRAVLDDTKYKDVLNKQSEPCLFEVGLTHAVNITPQNLLEKNKLHVIPSQYDIRKFPAATWWHFVYFIYVFLPCLLLLRVVKPQLIIDVLKLRWIDKLMLLDKIAKDDEGQKESVKIKESDEYHKERDRLQYYVSMLCCSFLGLLIIVFFFHCLSKFGFEHFSWNDGTSIWPLTLCHAFIVVLGIAFLIGIVRCFLKTRVELSEILFHDKGYTPTQAYLQSKNSEKTSEVILPQFPDYRDYRDYRILERSLRQRIALYFQQPLRALRQLLSLRSLLALRKCFLFLFGKELRKCNEENKVSDTDTLENMQYKWRHYEEQDVRYYILSLPISLIVFLMFTILLLGHQTYTSCRGNFSLWWLDINLCAFIVVVMNLLALFMITMLACIVVEKYMQCANFVNTMTPPKDWTVTPSDSSAGLSRENSLHWLYLEMIGKWTEGNKNILWQPTILFILAVASRILYYDSFGPGATARLIIGIVLLGMIVVPVGILRSRSLAFRSRLLEDLRGRELKALSSVSDSDKEENREIVSVKQIQLLYEDIAEYKKGIFMPIFWHPMMPIFTLLAGGISIPILFELLKI